MLIQEVPIQSSAVPLCGLHNLSKSLVGIWWLSCAGLHGCSASGYSLGVAILMQINYELGMNVDWRIDDIWGLNKSWYIF